MHFDIIFFRDQTKSSKFNRIIQQKVLKLPFNKTWSHVGIVSGDETLFHANRTDIQVGYSLLIDECSPNKKWQVYRHQYLNKKYTKNEMNILLGEYIGNLFSYQFLKILNPLNDKVLYHCQQIGKNLKGKLFKTEASALYFDSEKISEDTSSQFCSQLVENILRAVNISTCEEDKPLPSSMHNKLSMHKDWDNVTEEYENKLKQNTEYYRLHLAPKLIRNLNAKLINLATIQANHHISTMHCAMFGDKPLSQLMKRKSNNENISVLSVISPLWSEEDNMYFKLEEDYITHFQDLIELDHFLIEGSENAFNLVRGLAESHNVIDDNIIKSYFKKCGSPIFAIGIDGHAYLAIPISECEFMAEAKDTFKGYLLKEFSCSLNFNRELDQNLVRTFIDKDITQLEPHFTRRYYLSSDGTGHPCWTIQLPPPEEI